ncbi:twin-arginine translocation signal domain-containing protein [Streptomyces sp. S6]
MSHSINRRRFLGSSTAVVAAALASGTLGSGVARAVPGPYTPDWDSVDRHPAAPEQWTYGNGTNLLWTLTAP